MTTVLTVAGVTLGCLVFLVLAVGLIVRHRNDDGPP